MPEDVKRSVEERPANCSKRRGVLWRWGLLFALVAVLLIAVAYVNMLLSPKSVKTRVLEQIAPYVNGSFDVADVRARLFQDVTLTRAAAALRGSEEPDIEVEKLRLTINPWAYLYGEFETDAVRVIRPTVRLNFDEDRTANLERLFQTAAWDSAGATDTPRDLDAGVQIDDGTLLWTDPAVFGDDETRRIDGIDGEWRSSADALSGFSFDARVRGRPLRGLRVQGWADLSEKWWFRTRAEARDLEVDPELLKLLPKEANDSLSVFKVSGNLAGSFDLDLDRGRPPKFNLTASLSGGEVLWTGPDLLFEKALINAHFDPSGISFPTISSLLWNGLLTGQGKILLDPDGAVRLRLWAHLQDIQISNITAQFMPEETPRPGRISGHLRFHGDLREPRKISGQGRVEMHDAAIYELPLLATTFKWMKLEFTGRETIRSGEAVFHFDFQRERVVFDRVAVQSANVEVSGKGWIAFDKRMDFEVAVATLKGSSLPIIGDVIQFFVGGIERLVKRVRIYGTLDDREHENMLLKDTRRVLGDLAELIRVPAWRSEETEKPKEPEAPEKP